MAGLYELEEILSAVITKTTDEPLEEQKQIQEGHFDSVYLMKVGFTGVRRTERTRNIIRSHL